MHKSMMKSSTVMACCMLAVAISAGTFSLIVPAKTVADDRDVNSQGDVNSEGSVTCPHQVIADDSADDRTMAILAEYIARNTSGVQTVFNELQIRHSG